jgi:FtsH-binding integral membrane protein
MYKKEEYVINKKTKEVSSYLVKVFRNMAVGLLITFSVSFLIANIFTDIAIFFLSNPLFSIGVLIGQIGLIYGMHKKVAKLEENNLSLFYYGFTFLNGLILTYIYFIFRVEEIVFALMGTGVFFGSMATYGYLTKKDLSSWGSILRVVLISIGIISIILSLSSAIFNYHNVFLSLAISCGTVVLMSLYTAYDMQNIIKLYKHHSNNEKAKNIISIIGAWNLYMNFIVIFQHLLRILSHLRNDKR